LLRLPSAISGDWWSQSGAAARLTEIDLAGRVRIGAQFAATS
jgi:hypothetical protein